MIRELAAADLRRTVQPEALECATTGELPPDAGIIGQTRAVRALRFGLEIADSGFNVFVAGPPGIGKMTAARKFIEETARTHPPGWDWCYVHNFEDPYRPKIFRLPAGRGHQLRHDLEELIDHLRRELPKVFESENYSAKRDEIVQDLDRERNELFEELRRKAEKAGFHLETAPMGMVLVPLGAKGPLQEEEFAKLSDEQKQDLSRRREAVEAELKTTLREARKLARAAKEKVRALRARIGLFVVGGLIDDLSESYAELPDVVAYLKAVREDVVQNIDAFRAETAEGEEPSGMGAILARHLREGPFRKYRVNVLVDNSRLEGAPVVVELNPTYANLFGRIEKESEFGAVFTDFTMIRAGSLHRANGGFLVLPVDDVLREPFCWDGLKRALESRRLQIEEIADRLGAMMTRGLKPEAMPLDVKVVLVGQPIYYHLLHAYDETFPELFKVNADFDTRMGRSDAEVRDFLRVLGDLCRREGICHLDRGAMAKVLEHASRLAGDREKLSTRLGPIADLVREAHFWATRDGASTVTADHVRRALDEKVYRQGMIRERMQEMVQRGFILIDTEGTAVGQVNGLSVIVLGSIEFGKPSRITATVAPGREGLVDIEREVALGGPIHSKGVLILGGFLAKRFAVERPLSLAARIVFEQSYEGVEGDSASSTELYAVLSALADLPVRQGIAVTGSVNQRGEVQAIGGVNEKVEGYFDVCRLKGLTGEQGVLIPRSNEANLMLREDVVEAVGKGSFHVWTADTVDDGIELLTGAPAGERAADGKYPEGSVTARAAATLERFHETLRRMGSAGAHAAGERPAPTSSTDRR
jgi:lon-related putative ATP-dependent protease